MKKTFETPKLEWIMAENADVLTLSLMEGAGRANEIVDLSDYL